ncbi:Apoptosis-inducing factor 1 [Schistosoma japonicum]|uniref:Apoptosis-inducing factor 1 n=2 Tax=Schistosoma japonicum TaxID=6182 RepID=A0A4Z2CV45_SCHJA|nr:Apoptosis-inducing factor 1 [Schistosoma japonicum]
MKYILIHYNHLYVFLEMINVLLGQKASSYIRRCFLGSAALCSKNQPPIICAPHQYYYIPASMKPESEYHMQKRLKYAQYQQRHLSNRLFKEPGGVRGGSDTFLAIALVSVFLGGCFAFRWYVNRSLDYSVVIEKKSVDKLRLEPEISRASGVSEISEVVSNTPLIQEEINESSDRSPIVSQEHYQSVSSSPTDTHSNESEEDLTKEVTTLEFQDEVPESLVYVKPEDRIFPTHVTYIIVGAGAAGMSAARSIRASDPTSKILLISGGSGSSAISEPGIEETSFVEPPPYLRPPLSKELWNRNSDKEKKLLRSDGDIRKHSWLYYEPDSFFLRPEDLSSVQYGGVAFMRGDPVVRLDPDKHTLFLASGRQISYDRCLLATGGSPRRCEQLETCRQTGVNLTNTGHVSYFRNIADYRHLRDLADKLRRTGGGRIAVIGGGFLGSELSVSLLKQPKLTDANVTSDSKDQGQSKLSVIHAFRESVPMGSVLPPCLASAVGRFESSKGVDLWSSSDVVSLSLVPNTKYVNNTVKEQQKILPLENVMASSNSDRVRLRVRRNISGIERVEEVDVDHVVFAIGIEPNTKLSIDASLEIDPNNGGFLVNAELEARQGVYVAGDAASYWDPVVGCRRRVEHLNFAEEAGLLAGKNMVASLLSGSNTPASSTPSHYQHQSSIWSTLGPEISWDAVGMIDSRLLLTRAFFAHTGDDHSNLSDDKTLTSRSFSTIPDSNVGRLTKGVVFYLTPKEKRLVGILLWNMPDEIYTDKEYPAPSRLNVARNLLSQKLIIDLDGSTENSLEKPKSNLRELASQFDVYGEIAEDYAHLQEYMKKKKLQLEESNESNMTVNIDNSASDFVVDTKPSDK